MKYCSNCGAQLPDNANFCSSCGTRFNAPQQPYQQQPYQQPQEQPQKQKFFSMDNFRANREAQKQRRAQIKWWQWALIAIGVAMLIMMQTGA